MKHLIFWALLSLPVVSYSKTIESTFLQLGDYGDEAEILKWKSPEWNKELAYMKAVGINELIIQWTVHEYRKDTTGYPVRADSSFYPSSLSWVDSAKVDFDLIDTILSVCDTSGIKVYLGLLGEYHVWMPYEETAQLNTYKIQSIEVANELYQRYNSHSSFQGWYIPYEFNNWIKYPSLEDRAFYLDQLGPYWTSIVSACHSLMPGSPVFIGSYFQQENLTTFSQWSDTFALRCKNWGIDTVAFMDCVGSRLCPLDSVDEYFSRIKTAFNSNSLPFWSDLEIFQDTTIDTNTYGMPTNINRVTAQMDTESPYVDKIVTFEYNYFMSPMRSIPMAWDFDYRTRASKLYNNYYQHFHENNKGCAEKHYTISRAPSSLHLDPNLAKLTDNNLGEYVGWSGSMDSIVIKLNLGNKYNVQDIRIHLLNSDSSSAYTPESVGLYGSTNDTNYTYIGSAKGFKVNEALIPFCRTGSEVEAKFIKYVIPPYNTDWTLVSEVQTFGVPAWGTDHEGNDWTISSNTTIGGWHYNINNFTINSGVTVKTIPYNGNDTTGTLTIEANSINISGILRADSSGYASEEGPGAGIRGVYGHGGSGAGYGGAGGDGASNIQGDTSKYGGCAYGDAENPSMGSGGGNSDVTLFGKGGYGGGVIKLTSYGNTNISGTVCSNGKPGTGSDGKVAGGGSGGGIIIETDSLSGAGLISVTGGDGANGSSGADAGGGAGGRIFMRYRNSSFNGRIGVSGGTGPDNAIDGQPGTALIKQKEGNIEIYNYPVQTSRSEDSKYGFLKGVEFNTGSIILSNNDSIIGSLTLSAKDSIIIPSGSYIIADAKGYAHNRGIGYGHAGSSSHGAGGAGYGNSGGHGNYYTPNGTGAGGITYGDSCNPDEPGSGGGDWGTSSGYRWGGGSGGGKIKLDCSEGAIKLDGIISVNGKDGTYKTGYAGGGGAAGSISIYVCQLYGDGYVYAIGGDGAGISNCYAGGGAGGRVALLSYESFFPINHISVAGGEKGGTGATDGGAGTIYLGSILQSTRQNGPKIFKLNQNFPNPFRYTTTIQYSVAVTCDVSLKLYDLSGRCVKALFEGRKQLPGIYKVDLNARDYPAGIYFAKYIAGKYKETKKLVLMR